MDAVAKRIVEIRVEIAAIRRRDAVAAPKQHLHLPTAGTAAPIRIPALFEAVRRDSVRQPDRGVSVDGVVATEIQAQEDRHRTAGPRWRVEQDLHARHPRGIAELDAHLLAVRQPAEGCGVFFQDAERHAGRGCRGGAVNLVLE